MPSMGQVDRKEYGRKVVRTYRAQHYPHLRNLVSMFSCVFRTRTRTPPEGQYSYSFVQLNRVRYRVPFH